MSVVAFYFLTLLAAFPVHPNYNFLMNAFLVYLFFQFISFRKHYYLF